MENVIKDFPKKEYVEQLATKDEIADLKNKTDQLPDFQQFATKADIEDLNGKIAGLATKDEFNKLKTKFEKKHDRSCTVLFGYKKSKIPEFGLEMN